MYRSAIVTLDQTFSSTSLKPIYIFAKSLVSDKLYISIDKNLSLSTTWWKNFIGECYLLAEQNCPSLDVRLLLPSENHEKHYRNFDCIISPWENLPRNQIETLAKSFTLNKIPNTILYHNMKFVKNHQDQQFVSDLKNENHFQNVCCGGTFDRLHNGHKILLSRSALICSHRLTVGVTTDELLQKKTLRELIQPISQRLAAVQDFVADVKPQLQLNITAINDPCGPAITDSSITAIVASPETEKGCIKINEIRKEKGFDELSIDLIDFLSSENKTSGPEETKISSSNRRLSLLGCLFRPSTKSWNQHTEPFIIGLTGGIASGKSSIGLRLSKMGAAVVDCDKLGHKAYLPNTEGYNRVVKEFGNDIVSSTDGSIDRAALGRIIFADPQAKARLCNIVWPEIKRLALEETEKAFKQGHKIVIWDAAVLLDAHWEMHCHEVWATFIPRPEAIKRIVERNGLSEADACRRIDSQLKNDEMIQRANVLLCTLWEYEYTAKMLEKAWKLLQKRLQLC